MSESSSIPPSRTTTLVSGASGGTELEPISPVKATKLVDLIIQHAPRTLTLPKTPINIEGVIIYSNPQAEEVRVKTAEGEISLKLSTDINIGTKVSIKIYTSKAETLANIVILEQSDEILDEATKIAQNKITETPPPLIKEGHNLKALLLPDVHISEIEKVIDFIKTLDKETLTKLNIPLDKEIIDKLVSGNNIKEVISKLPIATQKEVVNIILSKAFLIEHNVSQEEAVQKTLAAYKPSKDENHIPPKFAIPETSDDDLVQIIRSEIKTKTTKDIVPEQKLLPVKKVDNKTPPEKIENLLENNVKKADSKTAYKAISETGKPYNIEVIKVLPKNTSSLQVEQSIKELPSSDKTLIHAAKLETVTTEKMPIIKVETKTAIEHFIIKTPVRIEEDSVLIIKATPIKSEEITHKNVTTGKLNLIGEIEFDPLLSKTWPALEESLKNISLATPQIAQTIKSSIPNPSNTLPATALLFLAALRFGSIDGWLGDSTLKALKDAGKRDLAEKLSGDFLKISTASKDISTDEWRAISMPLLHEEQVNQLQLLVRHQQDDSKKNHEDKDTTRFIINLELSRIGSLQLDSLIQKKKGHFNMIVRSENNLSLTIRNEISTRFASALTQVNMQGGISFQGKSGSWVTIGEKHDLYKA